MKKSVIIILSALIVINAGLGAIGFMSSLKGEEPATEPKEYEVKYKYYLDDVEVSAMPVNNRPSTEVTNDPTTDGSTTTPEQNTGNEEYQDEYSFKNYTCTNNVVGSWDNEAWEFIPEKTSDATCVLYFESNFLNVTLTANNGEVNLLEDLKDRKVARGEAITFSVTPKEGYKYEKIECKNNETVLDVNAEWNEENKKVTINEVSKDLTCEISFIIDEYVVTFAVNHGTLTETEKTAEYGEEVTTKITPADEYVFDKVTCTNNQSATFNPETNTLTIAKLTNKTLCTVNFKANEFSVTLKVVNGTPANEVKKVKNGSPVAFTISNSTGYTTNDPEISCTNGQKGTISGNLFQIAGVTNDTTCTVTFKAEETTTE